MEITTPIVLILIVSTESRWIGVGGDYDKMDKIGQLGSTVINLVDFGSNPNRSR